MNTAVGYPHAMHERTVPALLRSAAEAVPDQPALIEAIGRTMTYAELLDSASRIGSGLRGLGLAAHDLVLSMLDEHVENVATWFGANIASVVQVPINTSYKGESLRYVIEHSGARVLIIEGEWCDRLAAIADELTTLTTVVVRNGGSVHTPSRFARVEFDELLSADVIEMAPPRVSDISTIMYTSGTEGRAKGVLMPQGQIYVMSYARAELTQEPETVLVTLPLCHVAGLITSTLHAIRTKGTAILHGTFSVSRYWDDIRRFGCTTTIAMGPIATLLLRTPPSPDDGKHVLKYMIVLPSIPGIQEFARRFNVAVGATYGSTETGPVLFAAPGSALPFLCGQPSDTYETRLVDELDVEVPVGEVGELVIRSRQPWTLNSGYHRMPAETVAAWRNLWFHTGDLFRFDVEAGQCGYVDRRRDALRRRGENVSSFEVEQHLIALPHIVEAAVVGVPSEMADDEIKAVLVLAPGADLNPVETLRELYQRMPYFMVPRYLQVVDSLPKTQTQKVRKTELRRSDANDRIWDCEAAGIRITRRGLIEIR